MVQYVFKDKATQELQVGGDFGFSVAANYAGTKIAISDPEATVDATLNVGAVYVYDFDGVNLTLDQKLVGEQENEFFGCAIDMDFSGNYIAIGSTGYIGFASPDTYTGRIQVFENTGTWNLFGNEIFEPNAEIGYSVAFAPNTESKIAAGYSDMNPGGSIGFYEFSGTWTKTDAVNSSVDNFGTAISLRADITPSQIMGGADQDDTGGPNAGSFAMYNLDANFESTGLAYSFNGDAPGDIFGHSVSWAPNQESFAVGAPQGVLGEASPPPTGAGYVRIYNDAGMEDQTISGGSTDDLFGWSVSVADNNSNVVGIGAPGANDGLGEALIYSYFTVDDPGNNTEIEIVNNGEFANLPANGNYGRATKVSGNGDIWVVTYGNPGQGVPGGALVFTRELDATTTDPQTTDIPQTTDVPQTTQPQTTQPQTTIPSTTTIVSTTTLTPTTTVPPDNTVQRELEYWRIVLEGIC